MATKRKTVSVKPQVTKGVVTNCSTLNIRTKPTVNSEALSFLNEGDEIAILESLDGWYKIPEGYVMSSFVKIK